MRRRKNGFTLIELLVAIAIMISVTTVAVISITKVSELKKENAYDLVKEQVKTAALEYFSSNEYLFEGFKDSVSGYISVGRLVNNGLLNTIIDPRNGKKIDTCTLVKFTRKNGIFRINFEEFKNEENCDSDSVIAVSYQPESKEESEDEPEGDVQLGGSNELILPMHCTIEVTPSLSSGKEWYNSSDETPMIHTMVTHGGVAIGSKSKPASEGVITYDFESNRPEGEYECHNNPDPIQVKYDRTFPVINYTATKGNISTSSNNNAAWSKGKVEFTVETYDTISGINIYGANNGLFDVKWNNNSSSSLTNNDVIYDDGTTRNNLRASISSGYNSNNHLTYLRTDGSLGGNGKRRQTYRSCDNAGNCTTAPIFVNTDSIAPVINYTATSGKISTSSNDGLAWSGSTVKFNVTAYDKLSGINTKAPFNLNLSKTLNYNGLFYIKWNSGSSSSYSNDSGILSESGVWKDTSGTILTSDKTVTVTDNGDYLVYQRAGGSLGGNGKRRQIYKACDKVGNCTEAPVYANAGTRCAAIKGDIGNFLSVSASTVRLNSNNTTKAASNESKATQTVFTFTPKGSDITLTKDDVTAAFCGDINTCKYVSRNKGTNFSNNKKTVTCDSDSPHNCESNWQYVTTCINYDCNGSRACYRYDLVKKKGELYTVNVTE